MIWSICSHQILCQHDTYNDPSIRLSWGSLISTTQYAGYLVNTFTFQKLLLKNCRIEVWFASGNLSKCRIFVEKQKIMYIVFKLFFLRVFDKTGDIRQIVWFKSHSDTTVCAFFFISLGNLGLILQGQHVIQGQRRRERNTLYVCISSGGLEKK